MNIGTQSIVEMMPVEASHYAFDDTLLNACCQRHSIAVAEVDAAVRVPLGQSSARDHSGERRSVAPYRAHRRLQPLGGVRGLPEAPGHDAEFIPEHFVISGRAIVAALACGHGDKIVGERRRK